MKKQKSNSKMSKPILTLMMNPSITVVNPKTNLPFEKQKSKSCGFEGTSNVASNEIFFYAVGLCKIVSVHLLFYNFRAFV